MGCSSRIPDTGVKKAPDPGSATLICLPFGNLFDRIAFTSVLACVRVTDPDPDQHGLGINLVAGSGYTHSGCWGLTQQGCIRIRILKSNYSPSSENTINIFLILDILIILLSFVVKTTNLLVHHSEPQNLNKDLKIQKMLYTDSGTKAESFLVWEQRMYSNDNLDSYRNVSAALSLPNKVKLYLFQYSMFTAQV